MTRDEYEVIILRAIAAELHELLLPNNNELPNNATLRLYYNRAIVTLAIKIPAEAQND